MILAIEELSGHPALPAQWQRYYNTTDDVIYIQTLPTDDGSYPNWVEMSTGAAVRESMRITDSLVRSKYSGKDYQTYKDQTTAWLAEKYGDDFNDFMASDPAIMFIQMVSAALDQLSWYLDREVDEWYPEFSRLRASAAALCRYLGYKATPAVSGTTDLIGTLTNGPYAFDVTLRKGHQFQGPNSLIFELSADYTFPATVTVTPSSNPLTIYQGKTFRESFVSSGEPKQVFNLSLVPSDQYLAQGKTVLTVGGTEWTEYEVLPYSDSEAYEISYLTNPPQVKFGDGIIGKIPPTGLEIRVTYIATVGKTAQLATSGTIETSLTPIVVNFQTIPLSVTNPNKVSGASDPESIDSINANAPRWFDAAERLVTKRDIETIATTFSDPTYGAIAKANALSVRSLDEELQLVALLNAVRADKDTLNGYLVAIKAALQAIAALTGSTSITNSIRWLLDAIVDTDLDGIQSKLDDIGLAVDGVVTNVGDATDHIDTAKARLDFLPYHDIIDVGDGAKKVFSRQLAKYPVQPGSVTVFVRDENPEEDATDGDCDTAPGVVSSSSITFTDPDDVGKLIRVGGQYRQILKVTGANSVQYTGPRIYGTGLIVEVYPSSIIGYDDGGDGVTGTISGNGITAGSIVYETGVISGLQFGTAPAGLSGKYGVPVVCTYQYNGEGIKGVLDDALADCSTAISDIAEIKGTHTNETQSHIANVSTRVDLIDDNCDSIDTDAATGIINVGGAESVPDLIDESIQDVEEYLDTVISGECKANIVRVSCLVLDADGFYAAPSISLLKALKAYMDLKRIETVRYSLVSGDYYLLKVNLTVEIKVLEQYIYQDVSQAVSTAIDNMFKGRDYKQHLLRSEYYNVGRDVTGVDYVNITITETAWAVNDVVTINEDTLPSVDADGNLFIEEHVTITKGTVTMSEIIG